MSYMYPRRKYVSSRRYMHAAKRSGYRPARRVPLKGRGYARTRSLVRRMATVQDMGFFDTRKAIDIDPSPPGDGFISTSGKFVPLLTNYGNTTGISQGAGAGQRIGNRIVVKSIDVRVSILMDASLATNVDQVFHVWVVVDTQHNGVAPAPLDLVATNEAVPTQVGAANGYNAFRNLSNGNRFKTLKHKIVVVKANDGLAVYQPVTHVRCFLKTDLVIDYDIDGGTAGLEADLKRNNLYCLLLGSDNSMKGTAQFASRIRYTE